MLRLAIVLATAIAVAACGESERSGESATVEPAAGCSEGPPFAFDLRAADAGEELPVIEDPAFEFTDVLAVRLHPGAYTMYLADYPLDPDELTSFETPRPPAGKTLATVFITAYSTPDGVAADPPPIEVGSTIVASNELDGTQLFGVTIERGTDAGAPDAYNSSAGPEGTIEVLALADDMICVAVDYGDHEGWSTTNGVPDEYPVQKRLVGDFAAAIVDF